MLLKEKAINWMKGVKMELDDMPTSITYLAKTDLWNIKGVDENWKYLVVWARSDPSRD